MGCYHGLPKAKLLILFEMLRPVPDSHGVTGAAAREAAARAEVAMAVVAMAVVEKAEAETAAVVTVGATAAVARATAAVARATAAEVTGGVAAAAAIVRHKPSGTRWDSAPLYSQALGQCPRTRCCQTCSRFSRRGRRGMSSR